MNRLVNALGWGFIGLIGGAILGAAVGLALGVIRNEAPADSILDAAVSVGIIGALGAFVGNLLERNAPGNADDEDSAEASGDIGTGVIVFLGALLGALAGATIGKIMGADAWLLESLAEVKSAYALAFLHYHIELVGGPHVVAGTFIGILISAMLDVFLGNESSFLAVFCASLLAPVAAFIAALGGQLDWGTAIAIAVVVGILFKWLAKSGGGGRKLK